jgi:hypothetical protein
MLTDAPPPNSNPAGFEESDRIGIFPSTLCHELRRHLDCKKFGFKDSWPLADSTKEPRCCLTMRVKRRPNAFSVCLPGWAVVDRFVEDKSKYQINTTVEVGQRA